ncbi:MAG: tRNA 4-thiouridine(8) synthase ThiI [Thermodesulfobacteriota bacterium]
MTDTHKKIRALGLSSGGLDSILSALVLRDQGIAVEWISFETPFFTADNARKAALATGIPLTVKNITSEYLGMLKNPPCGYGQNMNPCMDCHALMANIAGQIMRENGFDFIFSGEVAGQRPMSQVGHALRYVEKRSGVDGYLLRPLSARVLPETIPEKEGLVDRNRLHGITGRSRKPQMEMAARYGVSDYPSPAGGCLLTDENYSKRLRDLFDHQPAFSDSDLAALAFGRHFRLSPEAKLIVGKNKADNQRLSEIASAGTFTTLKIKDLPGPTCLLAGTPDEAMLMLAAGICAGYGKVVEQPVQIMVAAGRETRALPILGIAPDRVRHLLL